VLEAMLCSNGQSDKFEADFESLFKKGKEAIRENKVVLVMVDDDEDDCLLVQEALRDAGFNCTFRCVQDGVEIMDYLMREGRYRNAHETAPIPDLILLDLNMPRMNGREVLRKLKTDHRFRSIPVIVLTTSTARKDVDACYDLGANSYMTKQSTFDDLVAAISSLLEYWLKVAILPPRKNTSSDPS